MVKVEENQSSKMASHPKSFTANNTDVFMTTTKDVLVTKDPVFIRKDVLNGRYIGRKPPNYMILSLLICILNPVVGPIALIFSSEFIPQFVYFGLTRTCIHVF